MTPAKATPTPITLAIDRRKILRIALPLAGFGLLVGAALFGLRAGNSHKELLLFWGGAVFCTVALLICAVAAYVTLWRPPALRVDLNGISGFYTGRANWRDIAGITLTPTAQGPKLAFALQEPDAFLMRASWIRRGLFRLNFRTSKYHLMVPQLAVAENLGAVVPVLLALRRVALEPPAHSRQDHPHRHAPTESPK